MKCIQCGAHNPEFFYCDNCRQRMLDAVNNISTNLDNGLKPQGVESSMAYRKTAPDEQRLDQMRDLLANVFSQHLFGGTMPLCADHFESLLRNWQRCGWFNSFKFYYNQTFAEVEIIFDNLVYRWVFRERDTRTFVTGYDPGTPAQPMYNEDEKQLLIDNGIWPAMAEYNCMVTYLEGSTPEPTAPAYETMPADVEKIARMFKAPSAVKDD